MEIKDTSVFIRILVNGTHHLFFPFTANDKTILFLKVSRC